MLNRSRATTGSIFATIWLQCNTGYSRREWIFEWTEDWTNKQPIIQAINRANLSQFASTGRTNAMPRNAPDPTTKKTQRSPKKSKPKVTPQPAIALTDELRRRFLELDTPRHPDDDPCPACGGAVGFGKVPMGKSRIRYVCVPCVITLQLHLYMPDRMQWRMLRLPALRWYLTHPERSTLHLTICEHKAS